MSLSDASSQVPLISLQFAEESGEGLVELNKACQQHGFFLLTDHGLDGAIDAMWTASREFFALPSATKRRLQRTQQSPLGYYDRELTKRRRDLKEVFDFMRPAATGRNLNQWPEDVSFKVTMDDFFESSSIVAERVLSLVLQTLGVDTTDLDALGDPRTSTVRLNYYPTEDPLNGKDLNETTPLGDMALHHHTDPGVLTLLLQDMTGGLQTYTREGEWIDVPPASGTIVVNLGDAMQVLSNDRYRAAIHRVTPRSRDARYSTPYFYNPPADAVLAPIPLLAEDAPKFTPFRWRDYIKGRVDDNFTDLGIEDIQIDQFRVPA